MPRGHTVAVTIELRVGAEPIAGSLRVGGGLLTAFRGWLELTSLLQAAADNHQAPTLDAPDTQHDTTAAQRLSPEVNGDGGERRDDG